MGKSFYITIKSSSFGWQNYQAKATKLWVNLTKDYINTTYRKAKLYNKGIGGNTSTEAVSNLPWSNNIMSDLAFIALGSNDSANQDVPVATYTTNLETLIDATRLKNSNTLIILCTPQMQNTAERNPYIADYRTACVEVASDKDCIIAHLEDAWTFAEVSTYTTDNLHANDLGHQKVFDVVIKPIIDNIFA